MSKAAVKKELNKLTKEQLIEQILDLYDSNKSVKEFYEFYLNPSKEKDLVEKYKKIIIKEFNVANPMSAGLRYSVAKKAITEFRALKTSPEFLADLMLTLPEAACEFTYNYGDMSEAFYNSAVNNFEAALNFIAKSNLLNYFQNRCEKCVKYASVCGYGFADEMADIYYNYYQTKI